MTNAPVAFLDLMKKMFQLYLDQFVIVFVDDILIYSKSREEHKDTLEDCFVESTGTTFLCKVLQV